MGFMSGSDPDWEVITSFSDAHVDQLCTLYNRQWWSPGRTSAGIRKMLDRSDVAIGLLDPDNGELAGFCRALSDGIYRAVIYDVMVAEAYQKRGLGRALMDVISAHPQIREVDRAELVCLPHLVPFYEKWGFEAAPGDWHAMIRLP